MTNDQTVTQAPFAREGRYIVIKRSHHTDEQLDQLGDAMFLNGIGSIRAVVVEADWPEYEPVWHMIEDRVSGYPNWTGDALDADKALAAEFLGWESWPEANRHNRRAQEIAEAIAFARHRTAHSGEGRSNRAEVRDEIHDALVRAYSQGANDVHAEWQKHWESGDGYGPPDPDFTESSHDHAASEMPGLGAAIAALSAPQGEVERLREALEPFARLEILAKRTGNVGIYGIPFDRIEKARAALAQPEAGGE